MAYSFQPRVPSPGTGQFLIGESPEILCEVKNLAVTGWIIHNGNAHSASTIGPVKKVIAMAWTIHPSGSSFLPNLLW